MSGLSESRGDALSLNYHSQLGLLDKGGVIKGLVVCWNIRIPLQADDTLDSLNDHFEVEE